MKNWVKKIAALAVATTAIVTGSIAVSAEEIMPASLNYQDSGGNATMRWGICYCEMVNYSNTPRIGQAFTYVYRDNTGELVDSVLDEGTLNYGESVLAELHGYSSNGYNFQFYGIIYNGNSFYSGIAWNHDATLP